MTNPIPTRKREQHGMSASPEYSSWYAMKGRCFNTNDSAFKNYGGRGISVCARWRDSFIRFYRDMGARPEGHSIERIDNDKNYEPSNCIWANRSEQNLNKRSVPSKLGVKNVYENKEGFIVRIKRQGRIHNFGTWASVEDAVKVRDAVLGGDLSEP